MMQTSVHKLDPYISRPRKPPKFSQGCPRDPRDSILEYLGSTFALPRVPFWSIVSLFWHTPCLTSRHTLCDICAATFAHSEQLSSGMGGKHGPFKAPQHPLGGSILRRKHEQNKCSETCTPWNLKIDLGPHLMHERIQN